MSVLCQKYLKYYPYNVEVNKIYYKIEKYITRS